MKLDHKQTDQLNMIPSISLAYDNNNNNNNDDDMDRSNQQKLVVSIVDDKYFRLCDL